MKKCNHIFLISKSCNAKDNSLVNGICIYCGEIKTFRKCELKNIKYIKKNENINSLIAFIFWLRKEQEIYYERKLEMSTELLKASLNKENIQNNL